MAETPLFPEGIALTEEGLQDVPRSVLIQIILALVEENRELRKRIEQLEARLNKDSSNSNQPPSSESPFKKKKSGKKNKGTDRRKLSHPGHRQEMLAPKETRVIPPEICTCGNREFPETEPNYTHQVIELPPIELEVIHFELDRGRCPVCGKM
ncbi:DUF6444 domain-containing protein [Desulfatiglans anilini]|uniref:DUF6444 domain-containing protein n=1 Tax=Desulfatiglans anilini TaxID=90728 RepID=UPI0003FBB969|nr:DUF6444 domain-containing protein [Desulfatiglans anilini]